MTLVLVGLIYGGTLLLTSGIQNTSLVCTFQWVMNGAQGTPSCGSTSTPTTGPQPQTSTPPGSVIFNGNPFAA